MPTIITICDTCKKSDWDPEKESKTDGAHLAELVNHAAIGRENITIRTKSCLMGCDFACNITIQGANKIQYSLGTFDPTEETAEAIIDYAEKYDAAEKGQVPYRTWPDGIKGHFRSRQYPIDDDE